MDTYTLAEATNDLAKIWNMLSGNQKKFIKNYLEKELNKEKNKPILKNQITIDDLLKEIAEDYRRKNVSSI